MTYFSWFGDFVQNLEGCLMDNIILLDNDYESVWLKAWPHNKYWSHLAIFYAPSIYTPAYEVCWGVDSYSSFRSYFLHHVHGKSWSLTLKFLKWVYLSNHSSESIHTWVMGTLEGLLTFHKFWPQSSWPKVGLEVKIWDTFKKVLNCFFFYANSFKRH